MSLLWRTSQAKTQAGHPEKCKEITVWGKYPETVKFPSITMARLALLCGTNVFCLWENAQCPARLATLPRGSYGATLDYKSW